MMDRPFDIYKDVTDRIVVALEAGTPPWRRGWDPAHPENRGLSGLPVNAVTGKEYRGVNSMLCMLAARSEDPRFCTFNQAKAAGWHVRAGEKGTRLVKWVEFEPKHKAKDPQGGEERDKDSENVVKASKRLVPVGFNVFHASQIDGIPPIERVAATKKTVPEAIREIQGLAGALGVKLTHGSARACYKPFIDTVYMPAPESFTSTETYAGTLLHELAHSTGHESRLNRKFGMRGTPEYAFEELRAELASVFQATARGIPMPDELFQNHAAYVKSWVSALQNDKREIFKASADAEKISVYINAKEKERGGLVVASPRELERDLEPAGRGL